VSRVLLVAMLLAAAGAQAQEIAPLPKGAKRVEGQGDLYLSPLGFRATVDWMRHALDRRGIVADILPAVKTHGVVYVRILARDPAVFWSALHIVLADGKTTIYIVAPKNGRGSSNGRTPDSGSGYQGSNPCPRTKVRTAAP
jgi:hypothetical protein